MNLRFRTAKPLEKNPFVLVTNQQQVDGVSKKTVTPENRTISNHR